MGRMNRKETAWRKNRKFGDVHGGRGAPKLADNTFSRAHSLSPPDPHQELPILMVDNPSSDYLFPLDGEECLRALESLPPDHREGITHLWLRRSTASTRRRGQPLAEFICGRGVRLITMYAWPKDLRLCLGRDKPTGKVANEYGRFDAAPFRERGWWYVQFEMPGLRRFWTEILFHEVGHHVDWYQRHWSKANRKQAEEYADQYAMVRSKHGTFVLDPAESGSNAEGGRA